MTAGNGLSLLPVNISSISYWLWPQPQLRETREGPHALYNNVDVEYIVLSNIFKTLFLDWEAVSEQSRSYHADMMMI